MPDLDPQARSMNDDYDQPTQGWAAAEELLSEGRSFWVATVRPDGRPHVMPVLAIWVDGAICFSTSHASQQSRNLERTPHAVVSVQDDDMDLVVEGDVERLTDDERLGRVRERYQEQQGWPVEVVDGALTAPYKAPTAGEMPFFVFRIVPTKAFALPQQDNFAPTRWTF